MAATYKPTLKPTLRFRLVLIEIAQKLSKTILQEIAFVYDMSEHLEKKKNIHGLNLFQDIISEGKLGYNDEGLIAQFVEVLNSLERSDLAALLTDYYSKFNISQKELLDQEVSSSIAAADVSKGKVQASVEQVQDVSSTVTEDTENSSSDEPQKIMGKTVLLCKGKKSGKIRPKVSSGASNYAPKSILSRKRKKQDLGAMDERQLNQECEHSSSGEEGDDDDPVEPHDQLDEQYMKDAMDEAKQSPDKDVQVGTVIVNKGEDKLLVRGHNRMPRRCETLSWNDNEQNLLDSKYPYVFHSIKAALSDAFKKDFNMEGATIYTTLFPANTDAQWIAECGIKELVYLNNRYKRKMFAIAAKKILDISGIKYRRMAQV